MPYCRVDRWKSGGWLINYCENGGRGHNGEQRNIIVSYNNVLRGPTVHSQMSRLWNRASERHEVQIIAVIQSFSKKEFNPEDPLHQAIVNHIGTEFAREHYPDRQAVVYTQIDGKSGLLHNHILINDVGIYDYRACDHEQYRFDNVKQWTNEIAEQYTKLDIPDERAQEKKTTTERHKEEKGEWSIRADIKQRVRKSMVGAVSESDFFDRLRRNGIAVEKKQSKKYGEHYVYELLEIPEGEKVRNTKARSYKLGMAYGVEALNKCLEVQHGSIAKPIQYESEEEPEMRYRKHKTENDKKVSVDGDKTVDDHDPVNEDYQMMSALNVLGFESFEEFLSHETEDDISNEEWEAMLSDHDFDMDIWGDYIQEIQFENGESETVFEAGNGARDKAEIIVDKQGEDDELIDGLVDEDGEDVGFDDGSYEDPLDELPEPLKDESVDDGVFNNDSEFIRKADYDGDSDDIVVSRDVSNRIHRKMAQSQRKITRRVPDYSEDFITPDDNDEELELF